MAIPNPILPRLAPLPPLNIQGVRGPLTPINPRMPLPPAPPGGISGFLARPGIAQALLALGGNLLAESDRPGGSLGGAIGRSLPGGLQALQQGRQEAEVNALIENAPPEMRQLLRALPPHARVPALLRLTQGAEPELEFRDLANGRVGVFNKRTGELVRTEGPEAAAEDPAADERALLGFYESLSPEQQTRYDKLFGKGPLVTVNTGEPDITKLPVGAQSVVTGAQGVRSALGRFEGFAKDWFELPATARAAGKVGVPNEKRDVLLGNIESVRQELLLELKNLAGLGVLAGPDMDIMNEMIGDPTSFGALLRSPEFMLTRIDRVRDFVNSKIDAYERTYGIKVPGAEPDTSAAPGASFFDRHPTLRPPGN